MPSFSNPLVFWKCFAIKAALLHLRPHVLVLFEHNAFPRIKMGYTFAPVNDRDGLIAMCVIFSITSTTAVVLRFYSRKFKGLRFQADDWLIAASLIFVLGLNAMFLAGCVQRVITGHSPVVNDWPISTQTEHMAQKYKYGFQTTEKIAFGLIKLSILFLWRRIFGHVRAFNIASWIMIGIIAAWSTAFFFATVFQCGTAWTLNWAPIGLFLTQCSNTLNMLTVFTATDIITDLLIIAMPIPMIWSLQMSVRRKVAISAMFLVGFFAIGAGIARMVAYLVTSYEKESNPDFIQDFTIFLLWSLIELNVAMICACLPTLLPVVAKIPRSFKTFDSSKRLLSFSRLRTQRSQKRLDSDSYSTSSSNTLNEKPLGAQAKRFEPSIETTISTMPHNFHIEHHPRTDHNILVHSNISRHDDSMV
ncbi:hypothetical protein N7G274_009687 [Stereocaulon virgatum]|uniref:Rhodopsin domain-containing protein n=1 Tax=Stereocaulon virgatum TaxID=373712 RepID=A0ABR3ZVE2_9LECA